ncbi:MAG: M20 family metallopeptidase [bacterium]
MNLLKLTQKLISIPSYVNSRTNEKAIGDFVFGYLKQFDYLSVKKQKIKTDRFNIIAKTKGQSRLFLAAHMDTAEPKTGWSKKQLVGTIKNNKLFGLGALDNKSGLATILDSLNDLKDVSGLTLLFYCDEEYDFKGMKKFVSQYNKEIGNLAIVVEPSDLKIWNAQRGLIEIHFAIQGRTGHSANPANSNNAIDGITDILSDIKKWLMQFRDRVLGESSMNIAYIRGGLNLGQKNRSKILIGKQGNNIADFAEAVIEIRPSTLELNAKKIIQRIIKVTKAKKLRVLDFCIKHNYSALYAKKECVDRFEMIMKKILGKIEYLDASKKGYGDGQLLQEKFNIPVVYFGPRGANAHGIDEWVDIISLKKLRKIYSSVIRRYCQ